MRKLIPLLLLLLLLPLAAMAATSVDVTIREMGFDYAITSDEQWLVLIWDGPVQDGRQVLYNPEGHFTGAVELAHSGQGGKLTVTVETLNAKSLFKKQFTLPKAADYQAPAGQSSANVKTLTLTETPTGFKYSFTAAGTDYQRLYYRSKQESATITIYPVNASGLYEGEIEMPLTYARTLITVQVLNGKGVMKKEGTVRKGYEAPPAPEAQEGRLSGVIVCIDPGHQENGVPSREPKGPGIPGYGNGSNGMAQGRTTLRKESIVCLETAMILRDLLIQEGATVVMTRETNSGSYSNMERSEIANAAGAHIMLRLHCDTSENRNKQGLSVWCPLNSEYAKAVCDKTEYRRLANIFLDEMKIAGGYERTDKTGFVTLTDQFIGNNWAKMLCFLVEMGFMSNAEEDLKLASPEYQRILSEGMVEGVYKVALERGWITE